MKNVLACIDNSSATPAVCDYAAWAALRLGTPLLFLHVLDWSEYPVERNLSGNLGMGSREALLAELAELDAQRGKLAMEQGKLLLAAARERAMEAGVEASETRQRHGELVDTLAELEEAIRLLVIGKQGERGDSIGEHIGSHIENVVRTMHRPILVTTGEFKAPKRVMIAFDGSATTRKGVEMVASSPLFSELPCHLLMVGEASEARREQLAWAQQTLEKAGFEAPATIEAGEVEQVICKYRQAHDIDMLIMGAYGHSRIRQFLVGSTTSTIVRQADVPVLLLR